jgi:hypothetical protein
MFKISTISFFVGSALAAAPAEFRTPLHYVRGNNLAVNLTISNSAGVHRIEAILTHAQWTLLATDASELGPATMSFEGFSSSESIFEVGTRLPSYFTPRATPYIGIGGLSDLTQQVGSVAVMTYVKNRPELILGSRSELFIAHCIPETLVSLIMFGDNSVIPRMEMRYSEVSFEKLITRFESGRHLFSVPHAMFERILESISLAGGHRVEAGSFSDCTPDIVSRLADITLTFESGALIFLPEDYVSFNRVDNTCQLLISQTRNEHELAINPLRLPKRNVRVTRDNQWEICVSSTTYLSDPFYRRYIPRTTKSPQDLLRLLEYTTSYPFSGNPTAYPMYFSNTTSNPRISERRYCCF